MSINPEIADIWPQEYPFPISRKVASNRIQEADKLFKYHDGFFDLLSWENKEVVNTAILVGNLLEMDISTQSDLFSGLVACYFIAYDQLRISKCRMPEILEGMMFRYNKKLIEMGSRDELRGYFQQRVIEIKRKDVLGWEALEKIGTVGECGEAFDFGAVLVYDLMNEWKNGSVDMTVWGPTIEKAVPDNF